MTRVQLREPSSTAPKSAKCDSFFDAHTMTYSLLNTIPPERVGLNGEYDHSGLAKRVLQAFQAHFPAQDLAGLRVNQRGKVVILLGSLRSTELLNQLTSIAINVDGAIDVETNGIRFR
ncbi:transport-associated protein [Leptolyngbya sp. NIES-3755]|nr:transport-associated protein [Leptolyngbya sp. NIES-3755]